MKAVKETREDYKVYQDMSHSIAEEIAKETTDLSVEQIQDMVVDLLLDRKMRDTAIAYIKYRYKRELARKGNTTDKEIMEMLACTSDYWSTENSNKNDKVVTTHRDYIAGIVSKDIAKRFIFPEEVVKAHEAGAIHSHDDDYIIQRISNCSLLNLEDMLENGTVVNGVQIDPQNRLLTATTVATQIIAAVASSQFGGCTITLTHLAPYVRKSYERYLEDARKTFMETGMSKEEVEEFALKEAARRIRREVKDAVQTFNYQTNSMSTTNGQAPFLTVFMYLDENPEYREEVAMLIEEFLNQRILGMKNECGVYVTPAFPKLIYCLDENNITEDSEYWYLTELAAKCTAKRMVPDYISAKKMKELKGDVFPCMGCRSFLTPDRATSNLAHAYNYEEGKHKYYGRLTTPNGATLNDVNA